MTVKEKIKSHPNVVGYFSKFPVYNKFIEKSKLNA